MHPSMRFAAKNRAIWLRSEANVLVDSKYVFLRNPEEMRKPRKAKLSELISGQFKTSQAWALKNIF